MDDDETGMGDDGALGEQGKPAIHGVGFDGVARIWIDGKPFGQTITFDFITREVR